MTSQRRIDVLSRHLTSATLEDDTSLQSFQPREMFEFLTRDNLKLRLQIMDFLRVRLHPTVHGCTVKPLAVSLTVYTGLQDDLYQPNHYLSLMEFREQTLQRLKKFCEQRFFSVADYTQGVTVLSIEPAAFLFMY